jgi:uncharacterized protein (DUF952 family)
MVNIFHVTHAADWTRAKERGFYECASLSAEGFIHCSEKHQVDGVLQRYFANEKGLVKLVISPGRLTSELRHEWSPVTSEYFPHIYGPINLDAVIQIDEIR